MKVVHHLTFFGSRFFSAANKDLIFFKNTCMMKQGLIQRDLKLPQIRFSRVLCSNSRIIYNKNLLFVYLNSGGQSCYANIAGVHSVATCSIINLLLGCFLFKKFKKLMNLVLCQKQPERHQHIFNKIQVCYDYIHLTT